MFIPLRPRIKLTRFPWLTLGLSDVVMGMMALAAYFAPKVKIFYFYFVFIFPGIISFPLWAIAGWHIGWHIGWDIFDHLYLRDWSSTNYVAHLGGALVALVLGMTMFRSRRHWADDLILDEPTIKDVDSSWLSKFRQVTAAPVAMYIVFIVYFWVISLFAYFLSLFSIRLLIVAPIVVASYYIYKSKKSSEPDRVRFNRAMQAMAAQNFNIGVPILTTLAEGGYTRAQIVPASCTCSKAGWTTWMSRFRKSTLSIPSIRTSPRSSMHLCHGRKKFLKRRAPDNDA